MQLVSIHAPARGATEQNEELLNLQGVSIHAPARGATRREENKIGATMFQSTRPRGARRVQSIWQWRHNAVSIHAPARGATNELAVVSALFAVSIHAPARGATRFHRPAFQCIGGFNPRAREGRDTLPPACFSVHRRFQSTRPRGARRSSSAASCSSAAVSIHAPARGATSRMCQLIALQEGCQ